VAEKVYLLEPPSRPHPDAHAKPVGPQAAPPAVGSAQAAPRIELDDVPEAWVKPTVIPGRRAFHPAPTLLALYTLGGVAPLALRVGRHKFAWATASALSLAGWATLVWYWPTVRAMMTSGRLPILPFLLGLAIVHLVGAIAWTHAVFQVVRDDRFKANALPRWMRHPWTTGIAGTLMPGAGLAAAGCHVRAAAALWNGASVVLAGLVLANSGLLWSWNVKSGADAMPKGFVEGLLVASAIVACLGGLAWIGTALDGARLADTRRTAGRRSGEGRDLRLADGITLALVTALVAFAMAFHPASLARDLDRFASSMRFEGYRTIPLVLQSTAAALDAGRPEYAMRVAELHVEMGRPEAARLIHERLRERWEVYAQMLLQTAAATRSTAPSTLLQPTGDLVPRSQELAPSVAGEPVASPAAQ
jgi:hypothetical protein